MPYVRVDADRTVEFAPREHCKTSATICIGCGAGSDGAGHDHLIRLFRLIQVCAARSR